MQIMTPSSRDQALLCAVVLFAEAAPPSLAALPHVWTMIDDYLFANGCNWTLESASVSGFVRLLDRVGKLEWPGLDQSFRASLFDAALNARLNWVISK